jgi:hypothetical protein
MSKIKVVELSPRILYLAPYFFASGSDKSKKRFNCSLSRPEKKMSLMTRAFAINWKNETSDSISCDSAYVLLSALRVKIENGPRLTWLYKTVAKDKRWLVKPK